VKYTTSLKEYVLEILKTVEYRKDLETKCVVAVAPILPGCFTQGNNFEDAQEKLIDAIELWIKVGLREGENMPPVNGVQLLNSVGHSEQSFISNSAVYA
jgi:predicted RNase H-like HicB family nuclease